MAILGRREEVGGEDLDELGLVDAGGAGEDERHRFALVRDTGSVALDRPGDSLDGLRLTDVFTGEDAGFYREYFRTKGGSHRYKIEQQNTVRFEL